MQNGIHNGIIDENLFKEVQEMLEENLKKKKFVKAKCFKEEFMLRGFIKCEKCGSNLTGSSSRSKNGQRHYYYHCNHCYQVRLRVDDVNQRIAGILDEIKITPSAKKVYDLMVKKIITQDENIRKRLPEKIEQEINQYQTRIQKLEDGFADELIDSESMKNGIQRYRKDIARLKYELDFNKQDFSIYQQYIKKGIDLLTNITGFYGKADISTKRKLLCSTFPENLFFSKEKSRI